MTAFVAAELRARRRMLAGLGAGAFVYLVILALTYESFGVGLSGAFSGGSMSHTLTAFSGSRDIDPLSPHGWMGLGFNHPMLMVTSLTVALSIGAGAIAGEVDSGRAQLLFSAPIDRTRFLTATVGLWALAQAAVLLAGLAGAVVGSLLSSDLRHAGVASLVWAPIQFAPLTLFIAAVSFLASALSATRGRALGIAIGVSVGAYLTNVVSGLADSLDWLRWLTPFGYYDPGKAITDGPQIGPMAVLVVASLVLLVWTREVLERRDLA